MQALKQRLLTRRPAHRPDGERGKPPQPCRVFELSRYREHVSTQPEQVETWADFVSRTRKASRLGKAPFARLLGVHEDTVRRWESGQTTPREQADVRAFAKAAGVDPDYALHCAGLLTVPLGAIIVPAKPEPGVELIQAASLPEWLKAELIKELEDEAAEDAERRKRRAARMIELADRRGLERE